MEFILVDKTTGEVIGEATNSEEMVEIIQAVQIHPSDLEVFHVIRNVYTTIQTFMNMYKE